MLIVAALLLQLAPAGAADVQAAQFALVRAETSGKDADYFKKYCVALLRGTISPGASIETRVMSTKLPADVRTTWIERLRQVSPAIVPAGECKWRGEDLFHSPTRSKPVLLMVVGPAEIVTPHLMRFTVFTTSGFLTETHTLYEVTKKGPEWQITAAKILLQA